MVASPALHGDEAVLGVVIVNWQRADDTIECLESLLRCSAPMHIVVVDNGSGDGSAERIADWAAGDLDSPVASPLASLSNPPVPKPLSMSRVGVSEVGRVGLGRLTLVASPDNRGFAGASNLGLQHLLAVSTLRFFWLLNNDTVVTPETPGALVSHMEANPRIGMCGTVVRHYWAPERVQALNGYRFNLWTGAGNAIGADDPADRGFDPQEVADDTDFVLGASLCLSRDFLTEVGLMAEDYFLYFEELDWARRNRRLGGKGFEIGFAHRATVFHKGGSAIGSPTPGSVRSPLSDYWLTRSRLTFARLHHPWLWPWYWLIAWATSVRRVVQRRRSNARAIARAALGLLAREPRPTRSSNTPT